MVSTLRLAGIFSDHAVLQRDMPLRIWGWTEPGTSVTVEIAGQTAKGAANAGGKWAVTLPPLPGGGPYTLTVRGADCTLRLTDIMLGEVWLCAGQSNMESFATNLEPAEQAVADAANWPGLRLLSVPRVGQVTPADDRPGMAWQICAPDTIPTFSAVGYCFGRRLNREMGVAIGLINTAVGGTNAETWCTRESLMAEPKLRDLVTRVEDPPPEVVARRKAWQAQMDACTAGVRDPGNEGWPLGWAAPATSDRDWTEITLPQHWQGAGFDFNGVLWFRKEIDVPAAWAGRPLRLCLGACDKSDTTYFNNVQVGSLRIEDQSDAWCAGRDYRVPGELVRAGRNVIAVRVYSHMFAGGMTGPAEAMRVTLADAVDAAPIPLPGAWRCKVERNFGRTALPTDRPPIVAGELNAACALYAGTIAPLAPYGIRGVIWYQGEANVGDGPVYFDKMQALINGWRSAWRQSDPVEIHGVMSSCVSGLGRDGSPSRPRRAGPARPTQRYESRSVWEHSLKSSGHTGAGPAFPFYFVQLTPAMYSEDDPERLPLIWEAQTATLAVPNTGMVVTGDIGGYPDVHCRNLAEVGRRLALWALAKTYGKKDLVYSGPLYKSMSVEGGKIRLQFDHVGVGLAAAEPPGEAGLATRDGKAPDWFTIAGEHRQFVPAEAVIDGASVVVWSAAVPRPVAVRFAWRQDAAPNLMNQEGLPASSFRTDRW